MPLRILSRSEPDRRRRDDEHGFRRHGVTLQPSDRRELERAGWRTTLEYRENHVRARNGTLLEVHPAWCAEAERDPVRRTGRHRAHHGVHHGGDRNDHGGNDRGGDDHGGDRGVDVISAVADTADGAWSALRIQSEIADVRRRGDGSRRAS